MQAIWKYPVNFEERVGLSMPAGSQVLCVQFQGFCPTIWVKVLDTEAKREFRKFSWYGTGHEHSVISGDYVGTLQTSQGLVFHLFDESYVAVQDN